jgi:PKD repeat protein
VKSVTCPALPDQPPAALTVQGQVRDKDGGVTPYSKALTITNAVPAVTFAATSPTSVNPGGSVDVQGSFTDLGTADGPWTYTITWGDGSATTTGTVSDQTAPITASHVYTAPGTWSATLSVKDKDGGTGTSAKVTITVANTPPVANANGPYSGNEGATIQFSSAGSSDPDGQTITYTWNFGDGSTTSASANATHIYTDNGTYTVTLTVKDASGAVSAPSTATVTVSNVAPTATLSAPTSVAEGTAYTLSMTGTDAATADRPTLEYAFDCGQGAGWTAWSATVKSVSCPALPDQGAALTVRGQIRDKDGGVNVYTKSVSLTNANPVATLSATSPTSFQAGGTLSVQASFTDKGANDGPWTYTISWGDGATSTTTGTAADQITPITASHVYAAAGTFSASITVKDKDGGSGTSAKITVTVSP